MGRPKDVFVRSIDRCLTLLMCLGEREMTLSELAHATGLDRAVVLRALRTLEYRGFVEKCGETGRYRLGITLMALAAGAFSRLDLVSAARPVMEELVSKSGESCILTVLSDGEAVCVANLDGPKPIRYSTRIGKRLKLHAGAGAKVLLAYLPDDQAKAIISGDLPRYTPETITEPEDLWRELERIRLRGYAVSRGEMDEGAFAIGAPIFDRAGRIMAGLTLVGPIDRVEPRAASLAQLVVECARTISLKLKLGSDDARS